MTVFPGWEFYAPVAGADRTVFDLLPRAAVLPTNQTTLTQEFDRVWTRIEEAHERSGVGNLVRPADLYLPPEDWWQKLATLPEQIWNIWASSAARDDSTVAVSDAANPALPRLGAGDAGRSSETTDAGEPGVCSPCPTLAKSSVWPTCSPSTTSRSAWEAALGAARAMPTRQLFRRRSAHHHAGEGLCPRWRDSSRRAPGHLRRARSVR